MLQDNTVKIFFAGDFCSKPSTSLITVSEELKTIIQSCNLKVVNFEVPLKPENTPLPPQRRERFFQNDDAPAFLYSLGFNVFSMANNHMFDWNDQGFLKTRNVINDLPKKAGGVMEKAEEVFMCGSGNYEEAYKVAVIETNGLRIGFMAICYAAYKGVFDNVTNHEGLGCAYIHDLKVNHVIAEAKNEVDYLFILPHDGIEYIDIPLPETIARYRDFIDWGADGVFGTHPHCPQGWEEYHGKPIFYSLGNFFFNSKVDTLYRAWNRPHWYEGLCVVLTITDGIMSFRVVNTRNTDNISLSIDHDSARDAHNLQICDYLTDKSKYEEYMCNYCENTVYWREMRKLDLTFHSKNLKESTKALLNTWKCQLKGNCVDDDWNILRLMKSDSIRNMFTHSVTRHNKNKLKI